MSAEKSIGSGRFRKRILTAEGEREVATRQLKRQYTAAFNTIRRLEGAQPRNGSMVDLQAFSEFAGELLVEYAAATKTGVLDDLRIPLPEASHLSAAIAERLKRTTDGDPAPKIPGVTALIMVPSKSGWRISIVGRNHVKPHSE